MPVATSNSESIPSTSNSHLYCGKAAAPEIKQTRGLKRKKEEGFYHYLKEKLKRISKARKSWEHGFKALEAKPLFTSELSSTSDNSSCSSQQSEPSPGHTEGLELLANVHCPLISNGKTIFSSSQKIKGEASLCNFSFLTVCLCTAYVKTENQHLYCSEGALDCLRHYHALVFPLLPLESRYPSAYLIDHLPVFV